MPSSDQHGAVGGRALVVHRQRAAALVDRAVVDHGDAGRGDALPKAPGEGARLLAVEIAFQAMPDRLVQQDAGQPGPSTTIRPGAGAID